MSQVVHINGPQMQSPLRRGNSSRLFARFKLCGRDKLPSARRQKEPPGMASAQWPYPVTAIAISPAAKIEPRTALLLSHRSNLRRSSGESVL
jgi:hypothetical protein